ncbi:hypothetical protein CGMCC3_g11037 [Colletotrichum fructicola]|nr:uncharacterized protein CGMCC3_g11037 [Colletotrichum fructicola]KAE9572846.1 hypothetical protein CGMCC3_g11037 [Colletotrichum fructicola]
MPETTWTVDSMGSPPHHFPPAAVGDLMWRDSGKDADMRETPALVQQNRGNRISVFAADCAYADRITSPTAP